MKLINLIDLKEWKTKGIILEELKELESRTDERAWRKYVEWYNQQFCDEKFDNYIVHGCKGYKLTSDHDEILHSLNDLEQRALNMLVKVSRAKRRMREQSNLKYDLERLDII